MADPRDLPREPPCARVPAEPDFHQSGSEVVDRAERDAKSQIVSGVRAAPCADQAPSERGGVAGIILDDERNLGVRGGHPATPGDVSRSGRMSLVAAERRASPARFPDCFGLGSISEWLWARTDLNRRSTGYEPDALGRAKLRARR